MAMTQEDAKEAILKIERESGICRTCFRPLDSDNPFCVYHEDEEDIEEEIVESASQEA